MIFRFLSTFYGGLKSLSSGFYYNWGMTYARWGQPARAIRLDEKFSVAYNNRGDVYIEMGQPDRAMPDLNEAIKLDPGFPVADANRAFAWTLLKNDAEAKKDVDAAVKLGVDRTPLEDKVEELKARAQ